MRGYAATTWTTTEREELNSLHREDRVLREEREMLEPAPV